MKRHEILLKRWGGTLSKRSRLTRHIGFWKDFSGGFTLAEVLITLGIIGVVAALVMPGIIQHHKKVVWVNQLKKSYSVVENAFKMAMAEDGVENIGDTVLLQSLNGETIYTSTVSAEFDKNLRKYFKIIKSSTNSCSYSNHECRFYVSKCLASSSVPNVHNARAYYLADGTIVGLAMKSDGYKFPDPNRGGVVIAKRYGLDKIYAYVYVDVNGKKGPSTFGRDVFSFLLSANGSLVPAGSLNYGLMVENVIYGNAYSNRWTWDTTFSASAACLGEGSTGEACTGRIIAEGWKMNY